MMWIRTVLMVCLLQEKRIYDLKKKNQELEKFKFVLDYKIKELKKQIEPRENDIKAMKDQIQVCSLVSSSYLLSNFLLKTLHYRHLSSNRPRHCSFITCLIERSVGWNEVISTEASVSTKILLLFFQKLHLFNQLFTPRSLSIKLLIFLSIHPSELQESVWGLKDNRQAITCFRGCEDLFFVF